MTALRDPQQPLRALELANSTRLRVANFKRDVSELERGEAVFAVIDAIETQHDDALLGAAKLRHMLIAIPGIGHEKARNILIAAQIYNSDKRLREITQRQRMLLAGVLRRSASKR